MSGPGLRAGVVLLFVFSAGAFAGMFFERHHSRPMRIVVSAAEEHEAAIAELREAIDLDDEQVAQIEAILASRQEVVQQMWEQLRPEVQQAMSQVHNDIAELLRPEQREGFHEWILARRDQALPH